ncbi:hypothetical protein QUF90_14945 [Desulfococcaceae bacterium HSG9]|nr:hypothetical protein [Desulfococcaceae bacterium HSG9]
MFSGKFKIAGLLFKKSKITHYQRNKRTYKGLIGISLLLALLLCLAGPHEAAFAEGSFQVGLDQPLDNDDKVGVHTFYVDIVTSGEVINIALDNADATYTVSKPTLVGTDYTYAVYNEGGSNLIENKKVATAIASDDLFTTLITTADKIVTDAEGPWKVELSDHTYKRFDISVTPNAATNPNPTADAGRLYALKWDFWTHSFAEEYVTDADYYILVPGGFTDTNFVWLLDLNNFSGNRYTIWANDRGVNAPYSGYSVPETAKDVKVDAQYPVYVSYPAIAKDLPDTTPTLTGHSFIDDAEGDNEISPDDGDGTEDTGNFKFTSNVAEGGMYAITIDTNQNGKYDAGDKLLLGKHDVAAGAEKIVNWDGKNAKGEIVLGGEYKAQLVMRTGEYHFITWDAETSGGTQAGLTVCKVNDDTEHSTVGTTQVHWDDATFLSEEGGTSNLPEGAACNTPEGHHTWGDFNIEGTGLGNETYIDTYVYGDTSDPEEVTVKVDGAPGVCNVTSTGAYSVGSVILITLNYTKVVLVGGIPQIRMASGGLAIYSGGHNTNKLTFLYTISTMDVTYGLNIGAFVLEGGATIKDADGNDIVMTLPAAGAPGSLSFNAATTVVIPPPVPEVVDVTSPTETCVVGSDIEILVRFSTLVWVKGTPQLALNTGGAAPEMAYYSSGSGTNILTFTYTVAIDDDDASAKDDSSSDLDYWSEWALELNDGQIYSNEGIDADLGLPAPGTSGSLGSSGVCGSQESDTVMMIFNINYAVYQFYNPGLLKHLLTMDVNEKDYLIANGLGWQYEKVSYFAFSPQQYNAASQQQKDVIKAVYRFYSDTLKVHHLTVDENEKNHLISNASHIWRYEGPAFYVPKKKYKGTIPVYRFYSDYLKTHHLTMDENEKDHLIENEDTSKVWTFEGIAFHAYPSEVSEDDSSSKKDDLIHRQKNN